MSGDRNAAREWRASYQRVTDLSREAGETGMEVMVPSTPDWSARDLLAHMVGVDVDAVAGNVPDDLNAEWTQGHVDQRSGASLQDVLDEWAGVADQVEELVGSTDTSPLGDVIIHEQDLRGALRQPGARDTKGLDLVRADMLGQLDSAIDDSLAPLTLRAVDSDWSWTSSGESDPSAVLQAPLFDLTRAVLSRRTEAELTEWTSQGDVSPYLPAFAHLGPLPGGVLPE